MTAINVILTDEYAVIVSDTLARAAGNPDFHVAKIMPCPHMRLAIATRGRMDAISRVVGAISVGHSTSTVPEPSLPAHIASSA